MQSGQCGMVLAFTCSASRNNRIYRTAFASPLIPGLLSLVLVFSAWGAETYYVAPGGDDAAPGTLAQPFRNLEKACAMAQPGDTVFLRAGTYLETLTPVQSGLPDKPITYSRYGDEKVVLIPGRRVTEWKDAGRGIFAAECTVDLGQGLNQVICNGDLMIEARYPNVGGKEDLAFVFRERKVFRSEYGKGRIKLLSDGDEARTSIAVSYVGLHGPAWNTTTARVKCASPGELDVIKETKEGCHRGAGAGYVFGAREYLDSEREWFLDSSARMLYFIPPRGCDPNRADVFIMDRNCAIGLSGKKHIVVNGIDTLMGSVRMDGAEYCVVRNSSHLYGGTHSFFEDGYGAEREKQNTVWHSTGFFVSGVENRIERCEVAYNAGASIIVTGKGNKVLNCRIHDSGLLGSYASGLFFLFDKKVADQMGLHEVARNSIYNMGRGAIHICSNGSWKNPGVYPNPLRIHHNHMANAMLICEDGGALYDFCTDGNGTEIAYNWIHDVECNGIYLDNYSYGFEVHHNVIYDIEGNYLRCNLPNGRNRFYNNTILDPGSGGLVWIDDKNFISGNIATSGQGSSVAPSRIDFVAQGEAGLRFRPQRADQVVRTNAGAAQTGNLPYIGAYAPEGAGTSEEREWRAGADWGGPIPSNRRKPGVATIMASDCSDSRGFRNNGSFMKSEQDVSWLRYRKVDLSKGYSLMLAHAIFDKQSEGGGIDVRLDGPEGTLIGRFELRGTPARDVFDYLPTSLQTVSGVHDVYLVCTAKPGVMIRKLILLGAHDEKAPMSKTDNGRLLHLQDCAFKKGAYFADGALAGISPGTWLYFPKVDFGASCSHAFVNLSVPPSHAGSVIEIRAGSIDGKLIGRHVVTATGSWDKNFEDQRFTLQEARGVQDIFVVFNAFGVAGIKSIRFPRE